MNPCTVPAPGDDSRGDRRWMDLHEHYLIETKEKEPDVLFIGDSLVQHLAQSPIWKEMFEPLHCLNFGLSGDQTQNVLWRMENGELDNFNPKVVVVLAGTNNFEYKAEQVADGLLKIVETINTKLPQSQVILMAIPPRGQKPNPLRAKIARTNALVAEMVAERPNAMFLNIDPDTFVDKDGHISIRDMYDFVHFTNQGYQKLCEPLLEEIQNLLKTFVKCESIDVEDS